MGDRSSPEAIMQGNPVNDKMQSYDLRIVERCFLNEDSRYPAVFLDITYHARDGINRFPPSMGRISAVTRQALAQKGIGTQGLNMGSDAESRILDDNVNLYITGTGTLIMGS